MYDELLRVPLIIANRPAYLEQATDELVSLVDVPPLIHDTLGFEIPDEYEGQVQGQCEPRDFILGEHEITGKSVVGALSEDVLYEYDASESTERVYEVRDGTAVPTTDLTPPPELKEIVSTRLEHFDDGTAYDLESAVDSDTEARLEALGYL